MVVNEGNSSAHAGGKVAAGRPNANHDPSGHVFTPMVADTLDNGMRTRIADGKALTSHPTEIRLPGCRTVQRHIARDDVLGRLATELR